MKKPICWQRKVPASIFNQKILPHSERKRLLSKGTTMANGWKTIQTLTKPDQIYELDRADQVILQRLRTGHCRLKTHLFYKFNIGEDPDCSCLEDDMTVEHVLQECPQLTELRNFYWPEDTSLDVKLYGGSHDLRRTASFVKTGHVLI